MNELMEIAKWVSTYLAGSIKPEYGKAVGLVAGVVVASLKYATSKRRRRSQIKRDLEILNMLDPNHPGYLVLEAAIYRQIEKIYSPPKIRVHKWGQLIISALLASSLAAWALYISRSGFSWWSLGPAFFSVIFITLITDAFQEENDSNEQEYESDGKTDEPTSGVTEQTSSVADKGASSLGNSNNSKLTRKKTATKKKRVYKKKATSKQSVAEKDPMVNDEQKSSEVVNQTNRSPDPGTKESHSG